MNKLWRLWTVATVYIAITTALFFLTGPKPSLTTPTFFFNDPTIATRVHNATLEDHNGQLVFLTRMYHNKITFILNNLFISLARSTDPTALFGLTHSPYYTLWNEKPLLFPLEFVLFLVAVITLVKVWPKRKNRYRFLLSLVGISLFIATVFLPYNSLLKLLPLVITIRLIIVFGIYELLLMTLWRKKLSLV